MMNKLDEVVIVKYDDLNALKLGIVSKAPKNIHQPKENYLPLRAQIS
jgi:hypothetical protein